MTYDIEELISRLAVALGIGLLMGLERGWRTRDAAPGSRAAGIRTFAISGLLGGAIGALAEAAGGAASLGGGLAIGLAFAAYAAVIAAFCLEENRAEKTFSATTAVAAMLTFGFGAYAVVGDLRVAAAGAVAAAAVLALRENLHGWIEALTWPELRSGLVLLAMTFIVLPIVPDDTIGPYGGVNPREVWIIAILLAAVSFAGYAAVKAFGQSRGTLLAGAAGGLASSTAVTIANARRAAAREGPTRLLAAGVALASAVMFLRVGVIVAILKPVLVVLVAPTLFAMAVAAAGYAVAVVVWRAAGDDTRQSVQFRNPFGFWSVIGFALLLAVIIMLGRATAETFGASGAILGAAIVGLVDVDAITVSIARLTPDIMHARTAALAILAAVATDTASKIAIGAVIGRGRFALEVGVMALVCFAAGGVALWGTLSLIAV
jgi:uncharacterized membrane protein (DUF4010 family)